MDRYPSARLRVEFDGPDVSQEVLYELFRVRVERCYEGQVTTNEGVWIAVRSGL